MKLAEALAQRSDAQRRLVELTMRASASARHQEGEPPAEEATALLAEGRAVVDEIEDLVRRINHTNSVTELEPGVTITDAIARRDALKARRKLITSVADAAAGDRSGYGYGRQFRTELRYVTEVSVSGLRAEADRASREFRDLDVRLQEANWTTELVN